MRSRGFCMPVIFVRVDAIGRHPGYSGCRPIVVRVTLRLENLNHLNALIFKLGNHVVELVLVHGRGQVN